MTSEMAVEAVRRTAAASSDMPAMGAAATRAADPAAVARFQAAMGVDAARQADPIPFASEASAAWRAAQVNNQGLLHRIKALSELNHIGGGPAAVNLIELQYDVMNLAFQQEVVTKVADKASNAIQTLVKNQ